VSSVLRAFYFKAQNMMFYGKNPYFLALFIPLSFLHPSQFLRMNN